MSEIHSLASLNKNYCLRFLSKHLIVPSKHPMTIKLPSGETATLLPLAFADISLEIKSIDCSFPLESKLVLPHFTIFF